ncbi:MAG: flagellar export protein FliJ [Thermodesulfobacteriota bacterium]
MGFKFRYESLLSYRGHLKEKAEIELGKAQAHLSRARQLLERYETLMQEARESLDRGMTATMTSEEVVTYADYLGGLKRRISAQRLEVTRCEKVVAEKRKVLLAKSKEYRIIEKLKEKDFQKWNRRELLLEQKKMNEVAVVRFGREYL